MDFIELQEPKGDWSFTFTLPPFKQIYYDGARHKYGSLPQAQQYYFLENHIIKIIRPLDFDFIDWVYEAHEDGRLHIHGYCLGATFSAINRLRNDFYTFNRVIGMSVKSYTKMSDIQSTWSDIGYWKTYIEKNQDNILFRSRYRQQLIDSANLDGKPVVFIEKNQYVYHSDSDGEPNVFSKTYDFKGKKNKFVVEF